MKVFIISSVAILMAIPLTAHADIYKCVNKDGKTTYQNSPCEIRNLKTQTNLIRDSLSQPRSFNNRFGQPNQVSRPRTLEEAVAPNLKNQAYRSLVGATALMPGAGGGMVVGGPLNGTLMPGAGGGMVVGGPLNGTLMPGAGGGMVVGGPLNGTLMPGAGGGMVVGGPLNGTLMPGAEGGMVVGGPLNGTLMPPE